MLLATVTWTNPSGGNWATRADWSTGNLPGSGDDVVIPVLNGGASVTYSTGTSTVASLTASAGVILSGGTLTVTGNLQESSGKAVSLKGGTLGGATLTSGSTLALTGGGGTLSGVTIAAGALVDGTQVDATAGSLGGLTLDGTLALGNATGSTYGQFFFDGTQTLSGTGTVRFGNSTGNSLKARGSSSPATLTIGAGITVKGGVGWVGGTNATDSLINRGTIDVHALAVLGDNWVNDGTLIAASGALLNLGGSFTTAGLGKLAASGAAVNLYGTLTNTGATLHLAPSLGNWSLAGGTIVGGTVSISPGAALVGTTSGGTLSGVTLDGTLDLSRVNNANASITDGLTLNGMVNIGATDGSTYGNLHFVGAQTLGGAGTVNFGGVANDNNITTATSHNDSGTLTIGPGILIHGKEGAIGYASDTPVVNEGTIASDATGTGIAVYSDDLVNSGTLSASRGTRLLIATGPTTVGGSLTNTGIIQADDTSVIQLNVSSLTINSPGGLIVQPSAKVNIAGSVFGNTTDADLYQPQGTVRLFGSGTSATPQFVEAMSDDLGNVSAGFHDNFQYNKLAIRADDYVRLVDSSNNSRSSNPEAIYANTLIVPSGSTLDLNGLHLYVRNAVVLGKIVGGKITQIPNSGPLTVDTATSGAIATAGELDNWTFFGRGGSSITVALDPGSGDDDGPVTPYLGWAQVQLIGPGGRVLATASDTTAGAVLTLSNIALPADGTYTVAVKAAAGHAASTGNYVVAAYDVTAAVQPLQVNQTVTGTVATPYSVDEWTFSAAANTQVRFDLLAESASGLTFGLAGPNGFSGFSNIAGGSGLISLPTAGTYTLTAQGTGGATGTFAFELEQTSQTTLTLGTPYAGTFAGSGEPELFVVTLPAASPLLLSLIDTSGDQVQLYARRNAAPTRRTYDDATSKAGSSQSILIPSAAAGRWYILAYAVSVVHPPGQFTLLAAASPVAVTAVTPVKYATGSVASLTLTGAGFTVGSSVALVAADGTTTYPASSVAFDTFTQLTATIDLTNVPQGTYSIRVTDKNGGSGTLPAAFTVTAAGQAKFETHLILPAVVGWHISSTFYIEYSNRGTAAMPAPIILLESSVAADRPLFTLNPALVVAQHWTTAIPAGYSNTVEILASGKVPGWLEPGESVTVPVYYGGMQEPWTDWHPVWQFYFDTRVFDTTGTDLADWAPLQSATQPAGFSNAAWTTVYHNLVSQLVSLGPPPVIPPPGTIKNPPTFDADAAAGYVGTWGGYVQLLDKEATYLGQLGEDVTDVGSLWNFAIEQADNALNPLGPCLAVAVDDSLAMPGTLSLSITRGFALQIDGRDVMGPFGLGWSTPWQTRAIVSADGTVTILGAGESRRVFQPDSRTAGTYFSRPGDTGRLTADGHGGYLLTEADGTATDYNANGTLNDIQDTNGNRITAGYTGGKLTSLSASSGASITIAYNAAGLIASITDSLGRTTTYTYDATNQHLISVTGFNGQTTSYTYNTTSGSPAINALTAIAFPGGTHQFFTYDSHGWLSGTSADGGAQPENFAYNLGQVTVTDGTGDATNLDYNEQGLVVKSVDPLGNATLNAFDGNFNLVKVTNPLGESETYTYNAAGEVTTATDFLGNTTDYTYSGPFHELASMTDANGNTTSYAYSAGGDLTTASYADGSSETYTYDPEGDATSFVDANGQPTGYMYNAAGQVLTESFSDGSQYTYTYDKYGDLLTATDATGTTTFTYDPTTELLTEVAYPGGLTLKFTDNAAGQRTSMVDQTGFTTNYVYDSAGRLTELTDSGGHAIVTYTYDADGRLGQKVNSNGTSTTYAYDADGNILHLINYAPDKSINSRFDYTYNALGQAATETTLDGTWTNTYDPEGRLTHAVFASTNPSIPAQDLAYTYDAVGNRVATVINGVTTPYTTNGVNEYTSVGSATYSYDANGNLLSDGTNTYTYNALNQLTGVTGPAGTTTYTYNALGQRVAATTGGRATQYVYDPLNPDNAVGVYSGGSTVADYVYGLGLSGAVTPSGSYAYDFNALASTAGLSGSSGKYVDQYQYAPFGNVLASSGTVANPFQALGQAGVQSDADGLLSLQGQSYDPAIGRLLSKDPADLGGSVGHLTAYALNAATGLGDTTGLFFPLVGHALGPYKGGRVESDAVQGTYNAFFKEGSVYGFGTYVGYPTGTVAAVALTGADLGLGNAPPGGLDSGAPTGFIAVYYQRHAGDLPCCPEYRPPHGPPPSPPGGHHGASGSTSTVTAMDPNAMIGPSGYGSSNFIADSATALPYEIDFENASTATAPAQAVTITDQLDPSLNWSTFELTGIAWGDTTLTIPAGSQQYETTVSMTDNGATFDVLVDAGIDTGTGLVTATFQSIDPTTQLPPDVLTGFLPPEDGTGRGMGSISFMIQPKAGLSTGTAIRNVALITFDQNPAIATDQVNDNDATQGVDPTKQALLTIDAVAPTSSVGPLPSTETTSSFTVTWSGQDDPGGSGIGSYNVYVSDNGGPYAVWQSATTQTSATFSGTSGHTYAFYSVATDNVGNVQPTPIAAQATTQVSVPAGTTMTTLQASEDPAMLGDPVTFTATVAAGDPSDGTPTGTVQFQVDGANAGSPVALTGGTATFNDANLTLGAHTIAAVYASDNTHLNGSTGTLAGGETVTANVSVGLASGVPESSYGQGVTFTATVSPPRSGLPAPAGTVQFQVDGSPFGGPVNVVGGQAVSPTLSAMGAGTHAITALYSGDPNYLSNSGSASQTVDRAHLTVTATALPMAYGSAVPNLIYTITGFVNGETATALSGRPVLTTTATPASAVGSYPITVAVGTLAAANYDFPNLVGGTLTIVPAHLTVTADAQSMTYGGAVPALTYTITGFVNGDTASVVSGQPALSTTATSGSGVGSSPITISAGTLAAANYDFPDPVAGTLTITPAHLTVTASNASMTYGGAVPALTYTITGFINGDTASVVSGQPALSTAATPASGVGSYPITSAAGTLSAANYDFPSFVAGSMQVTPAPLTIIASNQARGAGDPNPSLTASYIGFVNGDGPSSLTAPAVLATNATGGSPPGTYTITVGGAASPNYAITFVAGTLTVTPPTIHTNPPPPPVTLTNVQLVTNKKHQVTQIIVSVSGGLNAGEADSIATYQLATPGKKGSYTAKGAKVITLSSALYSAAANKVTLTPTKPFKITKPVQLLVHGTGPSGLQDSLGRPIDGHRDGQAGGDAVVILSRGGVSLARVAYGPADVGPVIHSSAVDALLERGDVIGMRRPGAPHHPRALAHGNDPPGRIPAKPLAP